MPRARPDTGVFRALGSLLGLPGRESISDIQTDEIIPVLPVDGSVDRALTQTWSYQDVDNIGGTGQTVYDLSPWGGDWESIRRGTSPQGIESMPDASRLDFFILAIGLQSGTPANVSFAFIEFVNSSFSPVFEILAWRGEDDTTDNIYSASRNPFEIALPWRVRKDDGWFPRLTVSTVTGAHQIRINAIIMTAPPGLIPWRSIW